MKKEFSDTFVVDRNVIFTDLRALQVKDFDVNAYTIQFNKISALCSMSSGDEQLLKQIFVDSLPDKVREHI